MAGRPPLRIGHHGKITRIQVADGTWLARCRFRDSDGITRIVERRGPPGDQHGKLAEDVLVAALADRRPPGVDQIRLDTPVMTLVGMHIERLAQDGRSIRTLDTYRYDSEKLKKFLAGVRVGESTTARIDAALRSMRASHGSTMARRSRTVLRGALQLAVLNNVLGSNPVRDVQMIRSKARPKGAAALTADELGALLDKLRASEVCRKHDLVDPITILMATGLRRSELLALRWTDFSPTARTLTVRAKVVRQKGEGLKLVEEPKTAAGCRTIPLPPFAIRTLTERRKLPYLGEQKVIFPSTAGTLRDPDNFGSQWREARDELGVPDVSSHSFRKSLATLIDSAGLSARIGADHLGHAKVSMTQDRYMARGRVHSEVAEVVERSIIKNDE